MQAVAACQLAAAAGYAPVRDQQLLGHICFRWQMVACYSSGSWCIAVLVLPATGCTVNAVARLPP